MTNFIKNILATIWLIVGSILWISLSAMSPQMGLEEIGELIKGEFLPALIDSGKFEIVRGIPRVYTVASIAEAKAHKPPKRPNGKPYHALYLVRKR